MTAKVHSVPGIFNFAADDRGNRNENCLPRPTGQTDIHRSGGFHGSGGQWGAGQHCRQRTRRTSAVNEFFKFIFIIIQRIGNVFALHGARRALSLSVFLITYNIEILFAVLHKGIVVDIRGINFCQGKTQREFAVKAVTNPGSYEGIHRTAYTVVYEIDFHSALTPTTLARFNFVLYCTRETTFVNF